MESVIDLSASIISLISPYLVEAGKSAANKLGETAWEKSASVYSKLVSKFKKNTKAEAALLELKNHPKDKEAKATLEKEIRNALVRDKEFFKEMLQLISEAKSDRFLVFGDGSIATKGGVAAGAHGAAIQGNVDGNINIT